MYFDNEQIYQLKCKANDYVLDSSSWIRENLSDIIDELSIPELIRLETTLTTLSMDENHHEWNKAKLSILLTLLETPISKDIDEIPTELEDFLAQTTIGWQDDNTYRFRNPCLRYGQNCRPIHHITDSNYSNIDEMLKTVFLDPNYGTITSHLFAYCLTALFVSRLKANNLPLPMPLHVSCSRNSNVYRLIEIIDSICDVNVPVPEICPSYFSYGSCDDVPLTVSYPQYQ